MKNRLLSLLTLVGVTACAQVQAANIVWVSDNPTNSGFSGRIAGTADDVFTTNFLAAHNVIRYSSDNAATLPLSAADITALNTNDLIILGRSLGSGPFGGLQGGQWNTNIIKPLICQSAFLTRSNLLGWFTGTDARNVVPMPLTLVGQNDPENAYIFAGSGVLIGGTNTPGNFDEAIDQGTSHTIDAPVPGGNIIALGFANNLTNKVIVEFPAGTPVRPGGSNILAGYRIFFASGTRESTTVDTAGKDNLTPIGEDIFQRVVALALNNGVSPTLGQAPTISVQPTNLAACSGLPAGIAVTATGQDPLRYQWFFSDGVTFTNPVVGGTNAVLSFNPLLVSHAGFYAVVITNVTGSVTSSVATVTITGTGVAFTQANLTNCPGSSATFNPAVVGSGTLTYTWRKGATIIQGPDANATYSIASVTPADAGTYSLTVQGDCNAASNNFLLVVAPAPIITGQPQNQVAPMGNGVVFSVTAITTNAGAAPLSYQWKTNGVDVTGATASTFAISNLSLSLNGTLVSVFISNCAGSVLSSAATLSVTPITAISFDFNTRGQYTNAPYNLINADWHNTAVLNFQPFGPIIPYENSTGGVGVATGGGVLDFPTNGTVNSSILHPITYDFSLPGKVLVASVMMKIKVPNVNVRNTQIGFVTITNADLDNSAGRAYMTVILESLAAPGLGFDIRQGTKPSAANTFFEGNSNTMSLPTNTWYRLTATFENTATSSVPAFAGTYKLSYMLENMGADGLAAPTTVGSVGPISITNADVTASKNLYFVLRGQENCGLDYWDNVYVYSTPGNVAFVQELGNQTVLQGRTASYRALVDGAGPYTYQWSKNGVPIPGAGNWKYTTPALTLADNGAEFSVTVTSPNNSVSSTSVVSVVADDLAVLSVGSVDGAVIGLRFNQAVDKASAETAASYSVNGTPAVAARLRSFPYNYAGGNYQKLRTNETEVLITPAATITGPFTVTVSGVTSKSGTPIGAANSAAGTVAGLTGFDVDPNDQLNGQVQNGIIPVGTYPGENYSFAPGQFEVAGGGNDIFGLFDGFRFVYTQVTGDFDVKVRVPYLDLVRTPNKGGLMARLSLDAQSPFVGAYPNPMFPGLNRIEAGYRAFYGQSAIAWGNNFTGYRFPDAWVRLRRVGNTFIRYSSTNGVNWLCDGQISPVSGIAAPVFPDTLYFGLAVDANVGANTMQQLVTAQFESYGSFVGYPGATITISSNLANATVAAAAAATLAVTNTVTGLPLSGVGEVAYLWQRSNSLTGTWTNMPTAGGTNNTVNTGPMYFGDNGAKFRVIISAPGALSVTSSVATVTVTDTAAPTLTAVTVPTGIPNRVVLNFSEYLSDSALVAGNYVVTNSAGAVIPVASASFLNGDRRTVILELSGATSGFLGVTLNGVQDQNNVSIAANTKAVFSSSPVPTGPIVFEQYGGTPAPNPQSLADLTNFWKYTSGNPDYYFYSNSFGYNGGGAIPTGPDNYAQKVYTYFVPPTTQAYKFYLRGDDFLAFSINTNAVGSTNPAGRAQQINMTANNANFTAGNSYTSVVLNAGQPYYMEVLWKEGGGGDGMSLAIRGGADTAVPPQTEMAGSSFFAYPSTLAPRIVSQVEIYTNLFNTGQNSVAWKPDNGLVDLSNALNSVKVIGRAPDHLGYNKYLGAITNKFQSSLEHYLGRVSSYFIPPTNGNYRFYLYSDDSSQLLINTNSVNSTDPAGATVVGQVTANVGAYTLAGQNINLTAGQRYYIEARWKEGTGGDGCWVAVRSQGDTAVPAVSAVGIDPNFLEFPTNLAINPSQPRSTILPVNPTVTDGQSLTFSGAGYGNAFIWLKNGQQVMINNELNSTRPTPMYYRTPPLTLADDGAIYALYMTNNFGTAIATSRVTVLPDSTPVTILSAIASQYRDAVVVTFNKAVTPFTAQGLANYNIPGIQIYAIDYDDIRRDRVVLRTSPHAYNTLYTLTVNGVRDFSTTGNPAAGATKDFHSWGFGGRGQVLVEAWTNVQNGVEAFLETDPLFVNNMPDFSYYTNTFSVGTFAADSGREFWGARVSGLFMPPSNGLYRFFTRGDDGTALYMNTNGPDAADKVLIAFSHQANAAAIPGLPSPYQGGFPAGGDNSRVGSSISPILSLTNGTAYYLEGLMKEGGGGDYMTIVMRAIDPVTLTEIGGLPTTAAATDSVGGGTFSFYGNPDLIQLIVASTPPTELFLTENDPLSLQVIASALPASFSPFIGFQWARSNANSGVFTNILPSTSAVLGNGTPLFAGVADDGAAYRVTVTLPGYTYVYETLLHVATDVEPPYIISTSSLDGNTVGIRFSEPVDLITGGEAGNYILTDGNFNDVPIQGVRIRTNADPRTVLVTLQTPLTTSDYTIDVFDMADRAASPNAGNSSAAGTVQGFQPMDIGAPLAVGESYSDTNGVIEVLAGGADIWGTADQGHFTLGQRSGDFDVWTRVDSLRVSSASPDIDKAGLVIRETTNAGSRTLTFLGNPPLALGGRDQLESGFRTNNNGATGPWSFGPSVIPFGIPNAWVRLKREGNYFSAFRSTNGADWVLHGTNQAMMPRTVWLGLGTTEHNNLATPTLAVYKNVHIPRAPVITTQPSPGTQNVPFHGSVSYTVVASSAPDAGALTYRWRRDGMVLVGTSQTLNIADARGTDSGVYTVEVGNDGGTVFSTAVTLVVNNGLPNTGTDSLTATQGVARTVGVATLLANDSDPEGSNLNFTAVSGFIPVTVGTNFAEGLLTGSAIYGNAYYDSTNGYVHLHDNGLVGSLAGSLVISDFTGGKRVGGFTTSFKLLIHDGSPQPADGFSFNFAPDLPDGTAGGAENGVGTGFSFCVDNYQFAPYPVGATPNTSGLKIRYNGADIAGVQTPGAWIRPEFVPVTITLANNGFLTVNVDGTNAFSLLLPAPLNTVGRFGLYARSGGEREAVAVDNLSITALTSETPNGGTVGISGANVTYNPGTNCGTDSFFYVVADSEGASGYNLGTVNVAVNPTAPIISACATNRTITAGVGCQGTIPDLTVGSGLAYTAGCGIASVSQSPAAGTLVGNGPTVVTITVSNVTGIATCQATVTVVDNQAPAVTCPANITAEATSAAGRVVNFTPTATDNCDGSPVIVSSPASGSTFPIGVTIVTVSASDVSGNTNTCTFTVTVRDTTAPAIVCPTNQTVVCSGTNATATYSASATDLVDASPTVVINPPSGSSFPVGTNTVTVTAYDAAGNTNTCTFSVIVEDHAEARLTITRSTLSVNICWPQTCTPYVLEGTPSLEPVVVWTAVTNVPEIGGTNFCVTLPADVTKKFFRLRKP